MTSRRESTKTSRRSRRVVKRISKKSKRPSNEWLISFVLMTSSQLSIHKRITIQTRRGSISLSIPAYSTLSRDTKPLIYQREHLAPQAQPVNWVYSLQQDPVALNMRRSLPTVSRRLLTREARRELVACVNFAAVRVPVRNIIGSRLGKEE